jgi:hypothetical protein
MDNDTRTGKRCFLRDPFGEVITRNRIDTKWVSVQVLHFSSGSLLELRTDIQPLVRMQMFIVGYLRIAVAESPGQFGNPEERQLPPLEAVTRGPGRYKAE